MNTLAFATIQQLRDQLATKQLSHGEMLDFFLERFARYDKKLGSALEIFSRDSILARLCSPWHATRDSWSY